MSAERTLPGSRPADWVDLAQGALQAFLLNTMWLLGCALVVTAPAATSALAAAVHRWRTADEAPTAAAFVRDVRARFWRDLALGVALTAVGAVAAVDLALIGRMGGERRVVLVLWIAVVVAIALVAVFLPVAAGHAAAAGGAQPRIRSTARDAALLALRRPASAVLAVALVLGTAALATMSPLALLAVGVVVAALLDRLADGRRAPA